MKQNNVVSLTQMLTQIRSNYEKTEKKAKFIKALATR